MRWGRRKYDHLTSLSPKLESNKTCRKKFIFSKDCFKGYRLILLKVNIIINNFKHLNYIML